ncbi:hypothetical protein ACJIZ3_007813 [Penstemon smallii]|uniref:Uncharacterized protein n=1 Tax=Penstemon smallii TaxID=265156 RepID=A0ABD3T9Q0_9LAMI
MLLRRTTTAAVIFFRLTATISHHFSTATKPFSKIPWKHRSKAIQESKQALTEYLHTTRSLPFLYAENIARNSPNSLWKIVTKIPFSPSTFTNSFERFLRYHPINELDFFLESIGLNCHEIENPLPLFPHNTYFLSDWKQFKEVCALAGMGFPWSKLGLLFKDETFISEMDAGELKLKINEIKVVYGFNSVVVIGVCLAFPRVLYSNMDGLLNDLKILFVDYDLASLVEGNVDAMLEVCRKIRLFYDLGCEMGKIGEFMGRSKSVFIEYSEEDLVKKIEYFRKLNVEKEQVGLFLLSKPETFGFDLDDRVISVKELLYDFGLSKKELIYLEQKYPHVFGRNRIANLPHIMRSMDLGDWFFYRMKNGDHFLLKTYTIRSKNGGSDKYYSDNLLTLQAKKTHIYVFEKLNFLHGIGFGENKYAVKALAESRSSGTQLQQRFDFLLSCGIEYSKLCTMVRLLAKILNQQESMLEKKIEYLCKDMGLSLQYLNVSPQYLCHSLEKRIKPRYKLHKWLEEKGYCDKAYSLSTIIASSEKTFIARISRIHPAAAKKWQELIE